MSDFNSVQPGQIIQFRNVSSTIKTTLDNGSTSTSTLSASQHTAIVFQNLGGGRFVLLEQNFNNKQYVTQDTWDFSGMTAGTMWIYQPVAKK